MSKACKQIREKSYETADITKPSDCIGLVSDLAYGVFEDNSQAEVVVL